MIMSDDDSDVGTQPFIRAHNCPVVVIVLIYFSEWKTVSPADGISIRGSKVLMRCIFYKLVKMRALACPVDVCLEVMFPCWNRIAV